MCVALKPEWLIQILWMHENIVQRSLMMLGLLMKVGCRDLFVAFHCYVAIIVHLMYTDGYHYCMFLCTISSACCSHTSCNFAILLRFAKNVSALWILMCIPVRWICDLGVFCRAGESSEVQHNLTFSSISPNVLHLESALLTLRAFRFIRRCMHNGRISQWFLTGGTRTSWGYEEPKRGVRSTKIFRDTRPENLNQIFLNIHRNSL